MGKEREREVHPNEDDIGPGNTAIQAAFWYFLQRHEHTGITFAVGASLEFRSVYRWVHLVLSAFSLALVWSDARADLAVRARVVPGGDQCRCTVDSSYKYMESIRRYNLSWTNLDRQPVLY